ncbi:MAG: NAD-dependent deacylase [Planctomycetes bacterium]|nr:NAD-dependent deacylase [Planctomycetota bacterium]
MRASVVAIARAVEWGRAFSVFVLTGAGISADSGLPTFRDMGGLWEGEDPSEVATPEAWARDPARVWRFYQERRARLLECSPNAAHRAVTRLEARLSQPARERHEPPAFTLVTQNVDDLHQRAGSRPIQMHGSLLRLRCEGCGATVEDPSSLDPERFVPCSACGYPRMRPDVVWFGELPYGMRVIEHALARCTHFVAIGTSGLVAPASGLLAVARARGARTIVHALERPDNLDPLDEFHAGRASEVLPALVERWMRAWARPAGEDSSRSARGDPGA